MSQRDSSGLIVPANAKGISRAVEILRQGGVVAYPTETFYGLGCRADLDRAVERIFQIKGRQEDKPLPLIVADEEMAGEVARMEGPGPAALALDLAKIFWPGPLTLLLEARTAFPPGVAPQGRIALRVSSHPVAQALARGLNRPLISTSANPSGRPPALLAEQAAESLALDPPDLIVEDDPCLGGPGSTILDLTVTPPRILRAGAVPEKELAPFIQGWA